MLVFPVRDLPMLARGKGNKIIAISGERLRERIEYMLGAVVLPAGASVVVHSGKRYLRMKGGDLDNYRGERGRRGNKLPRGFQKVDRVEVAGE
jgi:topoisomerase-4 subunit A